MKNDRTMKSNLADKEDCLAEKKNESVANVYAALSCSYSGLINVGFPFADHD